MIDIIPNWHPIFVHFTIALTIIAGLCYFASALARRYPMGQELAIVARWCLWLGAIASIATVIAGFFAYYTVVHDTASHLAMTVHRNWAIATILAILLASAWSGWLQVKKQPVGVAFLGLMLVTMLLVLTTAWYGAEVVFRYGIGVQSLPSSTEKGHEHHTH